MIEYTVGLPAGDRERGALLDILAQVFNFPRDRSDEFALRVGHENFRVLRSGTAIVGGLALVSMGQFFGGTSVPMVGIVAVGIVPPFRGRGAGGALMRGVMQELHERRIPLSTLYPATQPIYRAAGYEQAGCRYEITLDLRKLAMRDRALAMRSIEPDDERAIEALYRADVSDQNGPLDRGPYIWSRVRKARDAETHGYLVEGDRAVEGYVYYAHRESAHAAYAINVTDLVASTPEAARRLITFLADHRSMADEAVYFRPPNDSLVALLPEQISRVRLDFQWMLRLVSVEEALLARGYGKTARGEVQLSVHDDVLSANRDDFVLRVEDGTPSVERGAKSSGHRAAIDIRGLATLYAAHRTPQQLRAIGQLECDEDCCRELAGLFAGPAPWMTDIF